ncbi:MAG: DUF6089 family protein [Bacteroidales bacterium]|nr:DUF6089 family protein [Bacteroidales bacterium]
MEFYIFFVTFAEQIEDMGKEFKMLWTVVMIFCSITAMAQKKRTYTYELHAGISAANLMGDISGGSSRFQLSQTRPVLYLGGRYDIDEYFSGKVNAFMGRMSGSDAGSNSRDYSFSTLFYEVSAQMEWKFLNIPKALGSIASKRRGVTGFDLQTSPYIFAGIGFVYAEPELKHLRPLSNEELTQSHTSGFVLPAGLGIKSDLSRQWALGLEIGGRICTSDYLDGLYLKGAKNDDLYFFASLHLIYKIHYLNGRIEKKR